MVSNIIAFSDLHSGCQMALCPRKGIQIDGGGRYMPSKMQLKLNDMWDEFWEVWVPEVTRGEEYAVVFGGDALDGVHHGSTTQISHNMVDQQEIAYQLLKPIVDRCGGRYYHLRGTEAHVGKSAEEEEQLAKRLGAIPDENGNYARYELWFQFGRGKHKRLAHFLHHIGTSGRTAYETSAVMSELAEMFTESGRWGERVPDVVVRGHRHRNIAIRMPTRHGYAISFTTPAWQLKTPFCYKIAGARVTTPQIGGSLIRIDDEELFDRHKVWSIGRAKVEVEK